MKYDKLSKDELILRIEKLEHDSINTKNTNKKLEKSEEQNRFQSSLLNAVEQAVIVTQTDGEIIYWNPFAEQVYGWTAEKVVGRNIKDFLPSQFPQTQAAEIMRAKNP